MKIIFSKIGIAFLLVFAVLSACQNPSVQSDFMGEEANASSRAIAAPWEAWTAYSVGDVVSYSGMNYTCNQAHTALPGWEPSVAPTLWIEGGTSEPTAPDTPEGLAAHSATSNSVQVTWNTSFGADSYNLEVDGVSQSLTSNSYVHSGLTANSTHFYRVRAVNTVGISAWSTAVSITVTEPVNHNLPTHILTGYWQNFNNGAQVLRVSEVPAAYNIICISFADATSTPGAIEFNLDTALGFSDAQFKADIKTAQARGQKVIISVGGEKGTITVNNADSASNFANSLNVLFAEYGFDGVDIDLENGLNAVYMEQALRAIPPGSIIAMAPQTIDMQSINNEYFKLALAIKDILTVCNMQYYNSGTMAGYDGGIYALGDVDFLTALAAIQLENGLRPDQVGLGLPATVQGAGSGYVNPSMIIDALDCLISGKVVGDFQPSRLYPTFRGVMTWSINWDASSGWAFSTPIGAKLNQLNNVVQDTEKPSTPGVPSVSAITQSSVILVWSASSDNVGVTAYTISYSASGQASGSVTVTSAFASISGLAASTAYTITVSARDAAGNTSSASSVTATTLDPVVDTEAPSVPSGIVVGTISTSSIALSWTASTDNVAVNGYEVLNGTTVLASSTGPAAVVSGLTADTSYTFTVKAFDAASNFSAFSSSVTAKTLVVNDGPATGVPGTPSLQQTTWNGESSFGMRMNMWWGNNGTLYELLEDGVVIHSEVLTDISPAAQSATVMINNKASGTYKYVARLTNSFGSSNSSTVNYTVR